MWCSKMKKMKKGQVIVILTILLLVGFGFFTKFVNQPDSITFIDTEEFGIIESRLYVFDNAFEEFSYNIWNLKSITLSRDGTTTTAFHSQDRVDVKIQWSLLGSKFPAMDTVFVKENWGNNLAIVSKDLDYDWSQFIFNTQPVVNGVREFYFTATTPGQYIVSYNIMDNNWYTLAEETKLFAVTAIDEGCPDSYYAPSSGWNENTPTDSETVSWRIYHSWVGGNCEKESETFYKTVCADGYHIKGEKDSVDKANEETTCSLILEIPKPIIPFTNITCFYCNGEDLQEVELVGDKCPDGRFTQPPTCTSEKIPITCYSCDNTSLQTTPFYDVTTCPEGYSITKLSCAKEEVKEEDFFVTYKWYLLGGFLIVLYLMGSNQTPGPGAYDLPKVKGGKK